MLVRRRYFDLWFTIIKKIVDYKGNTKDTSMPDGSAQKLLDVERLKSIGWIHSTIQDFIKLMKHFARLWFQFDKRLMKINDKKILKNLLINMLNRIIKKMILQASIGIPN